MRRRRFITLVAGAAVALPLATRAQQASRVRVGFVDFAGENDPNGSDRARAFKQGLERLGGGRPLSTTTGVSLTSKGLSARLRTFSDLHQM
jgi:hypothetical protein